MLVGRGAERAVIDGLFEAARGSRSGALVIRGGPGVGKTALLEDARRRAGDMHVLTARGVESESDLPFAGLHQLLRPALRLLGRLPAPQAVALRGAFGLAHRSGEDRFLISVACLTLVSEVAQQGLLLCLIDDAHALDTPSVDALFFVARRLEAEGVVMLFSTREPEGSRFEARDLPSLRLRELDRPSSAALLVSSAALLVRQTGGEIADDVRDTIVEQSGGNPLALVELPAALSPAQLAGDQPLPEKLRSPARWSGCTWTVSTGSRSRHSNCS